MLRIVSVLIGYVFGCFQTAYIVGRLSKNIDIREHGSGNLGATNALRVLGFKDGALTFLGDFTKAVLSVILTRILFDDPIMGFYAGVGCIMGHNWPIFLKFKGGKGIASTIGVATAINPLIGLILAAIAFITIFISRFVSLGSILMSIALPILMFIFYFDQVEYILLGSLLMISALYRHKDNIKRLISGTENKLGRKKSTIDKA